MVLVVLVSDKLERALSKVLKKEPNYILTIEKYPSYIKGIYVRKDSSNKW